MDRLQRPALARVAFGFQTGQGLNQAGGNADTPNYNPMICGNPNDNALVRGPN